MVIRKALMDEKEQIEIILNQAKGYLKANGVDQWQGGFPNIQTVEEDITIGRGYVLVEDDEVIGYVCLDFTGKEKTYDIIDGAWLSYGKYLVVHRMAIGDKGRGKKLGKKAFELIEEMAREQKMPSIKIDTHHDNKTMRHVICESGFEFCGLIEVYDGERRAYEKLL